VSAWVARYRDAETGKVTDKALDPTWNDTQRTHHCVELSKRLRRRHEDIQGGDQPHRDADLKVSDAIQLYFDQAGVRSRTAESYEYARDVFIGWCEEQGVSTCRHITRAQLIRFKTFSVNRGERSPYTINSELRRIAVLLNFLVDAQKLRLTRDDVKVAFKKLPVDEVTRRDFLRAEQLRVLLDVAKRHDALTFKVTRNRVLRPRYRPIHDLVRFMVLSGLRPGETLKLTWDRVDLEAGELHVHPTQSKKRKDRIVDLSVCPTVVAMLKRMRGKKHERVWGIHTAGSLDSTLDRLRADPLCPAFDYQTLRVTCATFLACMPSYGPVQESRQLGHSITTAEGFYVGRVKVPLEVKTLEAAYGI
jgi:integrase